jgi:hypothetical protein
MVFFILKIAGISVILLLALLIFLLILLLFVPFRYRLDAKLPEPAAGEDNGWKEAEGKAAVRFLFVVLMGVFEYKDGKAQGAVKLFGIPVWRWKEDGGKEKGEESAGGAEDSLEKSGENEKRKGNRRKKEKGNRDKKAAYGTKENLQSSEKRKGVGTEKEEKDVSSDSDGIATKLITTKINRNNENDTIEKTDDRSDINDEDDININSKNNERMADIVSFFRNLPSRLSKMLKMLRKTAEDIGSMKKRLHTLLEKFNSTRTNEHVRSGIAKVWNGLKYLLLKIKPRKIKGFVHFGFDDPSTTGQLLGVLGIFYAFGGDTFRIEPDFERQIFYGELMLKGKIQLFALIKTAWKLFRDREVKYAYKRITRLILKEE